MLSDGRLAERFMVAPCEGSDVWYRALFYRRSLTLLMRAQPARPRPNGGRDLTRAWRPRVSLPEPCSPGGVDPDLVERIVRGMSSA